MPLPSCPDPLYHFPQRAMREGRGRQRQNPHDQSKHCQPYAHPRDTRQICDLRMPEAEISSRIAQTSQPDC